MQTTPRLSSPAECGIASAYERQDGKWYDVSSKKKISSAKPFTILKRNKASLPPAYNPGWVCKKPDKIVSLGYDAKGRKQATYSETAIKEREEKKEETMSESLDRLPKIIEKVRAYLSDRDPSRMLKRDLMLLSILILHDTGIRLGKEDYLIDGTHGLSTLGCKHAKNNSKGYVSLVFSGKHKVINQVEIESPETVKWMRYIMDNRCSNKDETDKRFFGIGQWHMHHRTLSRFVTKLTGLSPKTFRTLVANRIFLNQLAVNGWDVNEAVKATAMRLNNTPAVTRSSYIMDPVLAMVSRKVSPDFMKLVTKDVDAAIKECLL